MRLLPAAVILPADGEKEKKKFSIWFKAELVLTQHSKNGSIFLHFSEHLVHHFLCRESNGFAGSKCEIHK